MCKGLYKILQKPMKQNTKGIVEKTNKAKDDSLKDAPNTYTSGKYDKLQKQRGRGRRQIILEMKRES